MVSILDNTINGKQITHWQVRWQTPCGLFTERLDAILWCEQHDLDPELGISPVVVAVDASGVYERR